MKKICMILAVVLMATLATAQVTKPPKGAHYNVNFVTKLSYTEFLFEDTFEADLIQWQHISGTWDIVSDIGNVCSISGGSYVGGVVGYAGSEYWTNYSMEFDVKKVTARRFNVVFRYTDQDNYYLLEPSADCIHIALFRKVATGGWHELTPTRPLQDTTPGTWYHYKIVVQGPSIKIYVDETLKFDVTDFEEPAGKIGIGACALSEGAVYFDNVEVTGVNPEEILVAVDDFVDGLRYVAGAEFEILDNDAGVFDGDAAVLQLPCYDAYDVWCSARGRPGGMIYWGCEHVRNDVSAGRPTWHHHSPHGFSLSMWSCANLGPFSITTSDGATILALRWYPLQ